MCNEEAIQVVNDYFGGHKENYFKEEIWKLEKRWAECVERRRDYVEK